MIFLDTSFIVSLEIDTDSNYESASKLMDKIMQNEFGVTLISDYIFDETMTVTFGRTKNLEKTAVVGAKIRSSSILVRVEKNDFENAWELFRSQKGTKLSFTDCTNLAIMKRMNIKNIATFDDDFKKIKEINVVQ